MFNFSVKQAAIFQAVKWGKRSVFRFSPALKKLFFILLIFFFSFFLYGFLTENFSRDLNALLLGLSIISLVVSLTFWSLELFFNSRLKKPKLDLDIEDILPRPEEYNLAEFLSLEVARAAWLSFRLAKARKLPDVNSTVLSYFLLRDNPELDFIFSRAMLDLSDVIETFRNEIKSFQKGGFKGEFSPDFQNSILESLQIATQREHRRVEIGDILTSLSKNNQIFKKILIDANLKVEDVDNLAKWKEMLEEKKERRSRFWDYENLAKKGSVGKAWAAGYTITLDQFSVDWTEVVEKRGFEEIIGHKETIEHLERVLSRTEVNDALLIGEPGVGRKSLIHALAQRAFFGQSLPEINYKRIVTLDIVSIIASSQSAEGITGTLDKIFREVLSAGNIILVIDEFYNFVTQPKGGLGEIDISSIIVRYLPSPEFRMIGLTSFSGLHLFIEKNPAILEYMEKVEVNEISERETILILENFCLVLENKYKRFIPYQAIRDVVRFSGRYIRDVPFPKKAVDLLDEVLVYTSRYTKSQMVLPEYVAKVISKKTDIPIGELGIKEKEILLNLENQIHQRIINQEEAVKEISAALRRARADITVRKGPMGCFLFLGPTGVGKTETSKALSAIYFGSEEKMIRLDMSEFQEVKDIARLIGSVEMEGLLTTRVRENPFSLILLDEFEKAHPNILNLFLQVFDEGHLTDGLGRKISFLDTIIIATSNAGYQIILDAIKAQTEWSQVKQKLLDFIFEKGIFRPELVNRFDAVILFKPLTKENLLAIAELMLQSLKKNLKDKEIEFIITQPLKEKIIELGYDPIFGARQMRRVLQDKVENVLANALLSGKIKRGDRAEIEPKEFNLLVNA